MGDLERDDGPSDLPPTAQDADVPGSGDEGSGAAEPGDEVAEEPAEKPKPKPRAPRAKPASARTRKPRAPKPEPTEEPQAEPAAESAKPTKSASARARKPRVPKPAEPEEPPAKPRARRAGRSDKPADQVVRRKPVAEELGLLKRDTVMWAGREEGRKIKESGAPVTLFFF